MTILASDAAQVRACAEPGPLARRRLPFSVVAKPSGAACNLDCQYCFFLSKELLYDVPSQQMDEATLERYIAEYLAASPDGDVTMLWQGGEPTLRGLPFYRRVVELCETYRRKGQRVLHALQTNGTLIDDDWGAFLREHDVLVGVSIDGPRDCHDAYRLNRAGRGTHAMAVRGWRTLQRHGVRCNVLCTVHHANENRGRDVYRYLRDELGAQYVQFIPIVERAEEADLQRAEHGGWRKTGGLLYRQAGHAVTSRSADPSRYGQFLNDVFDEWIAQDVGHVFVQDFDAALGAMFGQYPVCVHAPECGTNMAMEFNGDVYACDHWVEPDWLVGNIADSDFHTLAHTSTMRAFGRKKRVELTAQCRACPFLRMCNGGCPKDRFAKSGDGEDGQSYLCPGYRRFFGHIRPDIVAMARLLRAGRPASDIMDPATRRRLRPAAACTAQPDGKERQ